MEDEESWLCCDLVPLPSGGVKDTQMEALSFLALRDTARLPSKSKFP